MCARARVCMGVGGNNFIKGLCVQNLLSYILLGMVPCYLRGNELEIVERPRPIWKMQLRIIDVFAHPTANEFKTNMKE